MCRLWLVGGGAGDWCIRGSSCRLCNCCFEVGQFRLPNDICRRPEEESEEGARTRKTEMKPGEV